MKATLIIMPASPALISELAPTDEVGRTLLAQVRAALLGELGESDLHVDLVGSRDQAWYTAHTGSLRAWGVPHVEVGGGNHLPELVQRYALGSFASRVRAAGENLTSISSDAVTLVALDGSTGLTPRAPSSLVEGADSIDAWCRALLAGEQPAPKSESELIDAAVREPQLWLELTALAPRMDSASLLGADTSHGVGRYAAVWTIFGEEGENAW